MAMQMNNTGYSYSSFSEPLRNDGSGLGCLVVYFSNTFDLCESGFQNK